MSSTEPSLQLLVGADPELFLRNRFTQAFVSAHDLLPGTKDSPAKVPFGSIQVDGTAAEFNIDPVTNKADFLNSIAAVTNTLRRIVNMNNPDAILTVEPVAVYDRKYFMDLPFDVKRLGCEPDFNAWTSKVNPTPKTAKPIRTAGGHIHLGWQEKGQGVTDLHFGDCVRVVRQLDSTLYVMSHFWDNNQERRELYGKMGAFRPKEYGVEYRPLSNAWLTDPDIQGYVYDTAVSATEAILTGTAFFEHEEFTELYEKFRKKQAWTSQELLNYHAFLVDHGMPVLPEEYLDAINAY